MKNYQTLKKQALLTENLDFYLQNLFNLLYKIQVV